MTKKIILAEFPRGASRRGTFHALEAKACITGSVNENLLRRIEYLPEENHILRNQPQEPPTPPPATIACGWCRRGCFFGLPLTCLEVDGVSKHTRKYYQPMQRITRCWTHAECTACALAILAPTTPFGW